MTISYGVVEMEKRAFVCFSAAIMCRSASNVGAAHTIKCWNNEEAEPREFTLPFHVSANSLKQITIMTRRKIFGHRIKVLG